MHWRPRCDTKQGRWEPAVMMNMAGETDNSSTPHVLVVDDDPEIAALLRRYLGGHGCRVSTAADGAQLRVLLCESRFDLILLDLGLPDEDGLLLLRHLQGHWGGPVIVVSGRGESVERVVGLELGADDYVTKPFDLRELLARIHSVLRRTRAEPAAATGGFRFDGMHLEPVSRRLTDRDGREVILTSGEFGLLQTMLERPNQVLTRDQLMNCMHGRDAGPFDRAIDVQISRLRRKIEIDAANPRLIKSVRGTGYVMTTPVEHVRG
jgi:two-component system, OmpR family, response regulator